MTGPESGVSSSLCIGCNPRRAVSSSSLTSIGAKVRPPGCHRSRSMGLAMAIRTFRSACGRRWTDRMSPLNRWRENQRDGRTVSQSALFRSSGASEAGRRSNSQRRGCSASREALVGAEPHARGRGPLPGHRWRRGRRRCGRSGRRKARCRAPPVRLRVVQGLGAANFRVSMRTAASNRWSITLPGFLNFEHHGELGLAAAVEEEFKFGVIHEGNPPRNWVGVGSVA